MSYQYGDQPTETMCRDCGEVHPYKYGEVDVEDFFDTDSPIKMREVFLCFDCLETIRLFERLKEVYKDWNIEYEEGFIDIFILSDEYGPGVTGQTVWVNAAKEEVTLSWFVNGTHLGGVLLEETVGLNEPGMFERIVDFSEKIIKQAPTVLRPLLIEAKEASDALTKKQSRIYQKRVSP